MMIHFKSTLSLKLFIQIEWFHEERKVHETLPLHKRFFLVEELWQTTMASLQKNLYFQECKWESFILQTDPLNFTSEMFGL